MPAKLRLAQSALAEVDVNQMTFLKEGCRGHCIQQTYGHVSRRWLIVHSDEAKQRAHKTVGRRLSKLSDREMKEWQKLCRQTFKCEEDAQQTVGKFQKACRYLCF